MARHKHLLQNDETIAVGVVKHYVGPTISDNQTFQKGEKVDIARAIDGHAGKRYRIKGTIRWLSEKDVKVSGTLVPITDYRFKKGIQQGTIKKSSKPKRKKASTRKRSMNTKPSLGSRYKGMDKQELKNVIQGLSAGDSLTVNFVGEKADLSGAFKVLGTKRGRGKGGSLLVELEASDGSTLTTGTPESNAILNVITANGSLAGFKNEADLPRLYEVDTARAVALKEQLGALLDAEGDVTVDVESSEEDFTGTWTVTGARKSRGRYGQVVLSLDNGTVKRELWSYRHSGIISRITVNR